jgi:hypothetical protein
MAIRFIIIQLFLFSFLNVQSQHLPNGKCGMTTEDQLLMESMYPNDFKGQISTNRNAPVYIPVKFHITANNDGSGRIDAIHVLNQLCILNQDYANSNFVFYIYEGFNYIDQNNIYNEPGVNGNALQGKKNSKALNVFITENATPQGGGSGGTVLGYYNPQGDYIVIRKKDLIDKTNTLSHEVGHFFSLRHTFYGWDGVPYTKNTHGETVTFTTVPGGISGIEVELMNGSNCDIAADVICDTPPDYNFGLTANNCSFTSIVYDKNGDKVIPMKNNQMSYFSNCDTFKFTFYQANRMLTNFNSSSRNYLRSTFVPTTTVFTQDVSLTSPSNGAKVEAFDRVKMDWSDVPGATSYLLEIRGQSQYFAEIVNISEFTATYLKKNNFYTWTVKPFNIGNACSISKTGNYKTGETVASATFDFSATTKIKLSPNPIDENRILNIELDVLKDTKTNFIVFDILGKARIQGSQNLNVGKNRFNLSVSELESGMYILNIEMENNSKLYKFIIQ